MIPLNIYFHYRADSVHHAELFKRNMYGGEKINLRAFSAPHGRLIKILRRSTMKFFSFLQGSSWVDVESQTDISKKLIGMLASDKSPHNAGIVSEPHDMSCHIKN